MTPDSSVRLEPDTLAAALDALELSYQHDGEGSFFVTLPGEQKRHIGLWLHLGRHEAVVECFVCRAVESAHDEVYRYLLRRNMFLRVIRYSLDQNEDIYLTARLARNAFTASELDTLLGSVLSCVEQDFNQILARGYADAIRREWAWRQARDQPTTNLAAFRGLIAGLD